MTEISRYMAAVEGVEGWFTPLAIRCSAVFLQAQNDADHTGDMLEIGAWHGKSALLWMAFAKQKERTHIVDIEARPPLVTNLERAKAAFGRDYTLQKQSSFTLARTDMADRMRARLRLIHIDGDHSGAGIWNDIAYCHQLLHPHGVMVIDDFMNDRFPQITEAVYEYLRQNTFDLSMPLVGGNKAFIVKAKFHDYWLDVLRQRLEPALVGTGHSRYDGTSQNRPCLGVK
jgi:predicted O-methyltransferase YrrM